VEECGYHCAGQSAPGHMCDPMAEAQGPRHPGDQRAPAGGVGPARGRCGIPVRHVLISMKRPCHQ
jgi:hypothetical protein